MRSRTLRAPVALLSLVLEDSQFFAACHGLPEPWASDRGTGLLHSFCKHVVVSNQPLLVSDARAHPLVQGNLAIEDLELASRGIRTRDELADQSLDELESVPGLEPERAGQLIMAARAHLFENAGQA